MGNPEKLQQLRSLPSFTNRVPDRELLEAPQIGKILPRGAIVELIGTAKTEWLCLFLALNPKLKIYWAERDPQISPTALHQRGVHLKRITFAYLGENLMSGVKQALKKPCFQIVVSPNEFDETRIFQGFHLLSEKANSTLILLGKDAPAQAWPISLQLEIHSGESEGAFRITTHRQKHGRV